MAASDVRTVTVRITWTTAEGHRLPSRVVWDQRDPLAVTLALRVHRGAVQWSVGRDLLDAAYATPGSPVGQGDVQVLVQHGEVTVRLSTRDGEAVLCAPARPVFDLLAEAARVVPPCDGCEELLCPQCEWVTAAINKINRDIQATGDPS